MKIQSMYASFIRSLVIVLLFSTLVHAQQDNKKIIKDTLIYKQKYGLRLGADMGKLARSFLEDNYTGFELVGDYRLTKTLYLAGEIGNEDRTIENEVLSNTTNGSYFKGGVDINLYKNWLDMENMIYTGFRVGVSSFSQKLNNFRIYDVNNQYWRNDLLLVEEGEEFNDLAAVWLEMQIGLKAELFNNFFAGVHVQLKGLVSDTKIDNYENLYIPGFNRTYDSGIVGAGYGFTLSYLVPIFKKDKIVVQEREVQE